MRLRQCGYQSLNWASLDQICGSALVFPNPPMVTVKFSGDADADHSDFSEQHFQCLTLQVPVRQDGAMVRSIPATMRRNKNG